MSCCFMKIQYWSTRGNQAVSSLNEAKICVFSGFWILYGGKNATPLSWACRDSWEGRSHAGLCAAGAEGPCWAPAALVLQQKRVFSVSVSAETADVEQKKLLLSVLLMASFCGKADCTRGCALTCSCLVSSRLRQSREKAQPLPGVVLGEKNLFTGAESLFLREVPRAHSVLFLRLTVGSFAAVQVLSGRPLRGSALPGCRSWWQRARGAQPGGHGLFPWGFAGVQRSRSPGTAGTTTTPAPALPTAPVSPRKWIHLCGCPQSRHLDNEGMRVQSYFFLLSLCLVVQPATGDRQRLPNCILHLFISKRAFVRYKRRPHYWL